jgi:hypothetical protein
MQLDEAGQQVVSGEVDRGRQVPSGRRDLRDPPVLDDNAAVDHLVRRDDARVQDGEACAQAAALMASTSTTRSATASRTSRS